jgi:hypothetical protein
MRVRAPENAARLFGQVQDASEIDPHHAPPVDGDEGRVIAVCQAELQSLETPPGGQQWSSVQHAVELDARMLGVDIAPKKNPRPRVYRYVTLSLAAKSQTSCRLPFLPRD